MKKKLLEVFMYFFRTIEGFKNYLKAFSEIKKRLFKPIKQKTITQMVCIYNIISESFIF